MNPRRSGRCAGLPHDRHGDFCAQKTATCRDRRLHRTVIAGPARHQNDARGGSRAADSARQPRRTKSPSTISPICTPSRRRQQVGRRGIRDAALPTPARSGLIHGRAASSASASWSVTRWSSIYALEAISAPRSPVSPISNSCTSVRPRTTAVRHIHARSPRFPWKPPRMLGCTCGVPRSSRRSSMPATSCAFGTRAGGASTARRAMTPPPSSTCSRPTSANGGTHARRAAARADRTARSRRRRCTAAGDRRRGGVARDALRDRARRRFAGSSPARIVLLLAPQPNPHCRRPPRDR